MPSLSDRAADVAVRATGNRGIQFNPMIVVAVIGVIIDMVKLYRQCQQFQPSPSEAARRGGWLFRSKVARYSRRHLQLHNLDVALSEPLGEEIRAELATMSDDELLLAARNAELSVF